MVKLLTYLSLCLWSQATLACFTGYYAPQYLDMTEPKIFTGVVSIILASILAVFVNKKLKFRAVIIIPMYFAFSYLPHWAYSGDCGAQIVSFNTVLMYLALVWVAIELTLSIKKYLKNA